MGSIFKRGKVYWIKYYSNGKSYRESAKTEKKMVASKLLDRIEGEIAQGKVPGIQFDKVTFDELADEFIRDYQINRNKSLNRAELSVRHLKNRFQGVKITELTTPKIQEYISERMKWSCSNCQNEFHFIGETTCPKCGETKLEKGAANATINRELAALRRILNLGARQTPPKVNRVPYIPMLKENNTRKGFFEHKDFLALRDALPDYMKALVTFGYKVGWRDQEITSLTWDNVDMENGIVTLMVGETKNDDARTVYMDDELKALFKDQWEKRKQQNTPSSYVFPNKTISGPIVNFKRAWNTACQKVNLGYGYKLSQKYVEKWKDKLPPGPIFHDFRRTAVRNMIRSGIPERVAMMISGHKTRSVFDLLGVYQVKIPNLMISGHKTRSVFDRYNIVSGNDLKMAAQKHQAYLESLRDTINDSKTEKPGKKARNASPFSDGHSFGHN
ncbi:MAG: tyrosine-type recombinase/integrase [Desulfatirhabdiaceae bacterium]